MQTLTTRDFPNVQDSTLPYLRDVADHLFRRLPRRWTDTGT